MVPWLLLVLAVQPGPAPLPEMLTRARELLEASDRAAARRELAEALRLYPGNPAVHNFLGVVEAGEGTYRAAEEHFREAVRRAPDYTDAHLNLGRLYQEHGEGDPQAAKKALAAYQAVLRHDPAHAEARFQSAALLLAMGEFGRSLDELRRLPAADQDRPAALAVRLADHAGKGARAEADAAAEKLLGVGGFDALDVRPTLPVLLAHGREDLAIRLLEDLRRRGRASSDDLQRVGLLREEGGEHVALHSKDPSEAIPYFRKHAQLEPKEPRGPFAIGVAAHESKDYETARRCSRRPRSGPRPPPRPTTSWPGWPARRTSSRRACGSHCGRSRRTRRTPTPGRSWVSSTSVWGSRMRRRRRSIGA